MTGAGGDEIGMERMELRGDDAAGDGLAVVPISPPAPVQPNPMRDRITARVRVLRSLRAPTVQQIEAAQFWEEYLRETEQKS